MSTPVTAPASRREPIEATHGVWEIKIFDDQPIAEGKEYAANNRVQLLHRGTVEREFLYPGYRIWTLLAHWTDGLEAIE